jgi:hypothetical protein
VLSVNVDVPEEADEALGIVVCEMDVGEVAVPSVDVDVPEEADEALEGSIVVCEMDVGKVAVPLVDVDVPEEVDEVLEDSIVVCEMDVSADVTDVGTDTVIGGDDTDAGEISVAVEIMEEVVKGRHGF